MIRIFISDDHEMIRDGLKLILEQQEDIDVVGEASTGRDTIELCRKSKPDVLLLDFGLPDINGLEVVRILVNDEPDIRILILTMHDNEDFARRLIRAGVSGFLLKGSPSQDLPLAIRKVARGDTYITPSISEKIAFKAKLDDDPVSLLSDRELQVISKLAGGENTSEIAENMCLSPKTVETYRSRAMNKLQLRNISDLTRFAIQYKIID